jgi:hypothetical protein
MSKNEGLSASLPAASGPDLGSIRTPLAADLIPPHGFRTTVISADWGRHMLKKAIRWSRTGSPLLVLAVALTACATSPDVRVDRLEGHSLADRETFAFQPSPATDPAFGPAPQQAAREELTSGLRGRGFRIAERDDADLLVAVSVVPSVEADVGDLADHPGGPRVSIRQSGVQTPVGDVPISRSTGVSRAPSMLIADPDFDRTVRTVVVDVFDRETQQLVWRGTSQLPATSSDRVDLEKLREHLRAITSRFPGS